MTTLTKTNFAMREEVFRETTVYLDPGMRLTERIDA